MKRIVITEGKLRRSYYDDEFYWAVNEDARRGNRVRIDKWSNREVANVLVPALEEFKDKKVRIVLEVLDNASGA